MPTAYLRHPIFLQHEMGPYHPESPARLRAHHPDYLDELERLTPSEGYRHGSGTGAMFCSGR